jgi:KDO2-lipid IV(A) lauroyltransferase
VTGGRSASLVDSLDRAASAASDRALSFGYLAGWRLVRMLPEPAARRLFDTFADEVYRRNGHGVRRLRANLAVAAPDADPDRLTRLAVRSYLRYWCELFRLPRWTRAQLLRRTRVIGIDWFRELYASGRGIVAPLPHMANWDWAGAWSCADGMPLLTVAERLRPERVYDEFVASRRQLGMDILPLTGAGPLMPQLERRVGSGGFVCLLADRDLSRTAVDVELCGARARLPRGPAMIARRTGAALVPVTMHYQGGDGMVLKLHQPVPASADDRLTTQRVADCFTDAIRAHPQDWHMMQRVFVG